MLAKYWGYAALFVVGIVGGIGLEWELTHGKTGIETPAAAVRQPDSSLVLQRAPDAKAKPAMAIPKGATVERVVHVEVQPRATIAADSGAMKQIPWTVEAPGLPAKTDSATIGSSLGPVAKVLCPPVGVDLALIKLKDGTQRVVASSRDGTVLDSLSVDRPVVNTTTPKVLAWDAGPVYGSVAQWGGYVGRTAGPFHVAAAGLVAKGKEPARALVMFGLRF